MVHRWWRLLEKIEASSGQQLRQVAAECKFKRADNGPNSKRGRRRAKIKKRPTTGQNPRGPTTGRNPKEADNEPKSKRADNGPKSKRANNEPKSKRGRQRAEIQKGRQWAKIQKKFMGLQKGPKSEYGVGRSTISL
jgi:hypothetical protein